MPQYKRRDTRISDHGVRMSTRVSHPGVCSSSSSSDSEEDETLVRNFGTFVKRKQETFSLHECVRNGSHVMVDRMLNSNDVIRGIDLPDNSGQTPLHYAAKANDLKMCQILINKGKANACIKDADGAVPLHYACRRKQLTHSRVCLGNTFEETTEVVTLLAKNCNEDFGIKDKYGSTPLHFAAMRGNLVAARTLLAKSDEMVKYMDQHGCTPLHEAATYNQLEVAALLIEHGARIRSQDKDKCTPLHLACVDGSKDMVKLLVTKCDSTVLIQLIETKDQDDTTALQYAVEARSLDIVKILVDNGAHVNGHCRWKSSGCTALHLAAVANDANITEYLIKAGAKVQATDNRNVTPLHTAAQYDCKSVADVLLKQLKSNINQKDVEGLTPLLIAVKYGSQDIILDLLNNQANVGAEERNERNVLHLAAENQQDGALKIILDHIRETEHLTLINEQDRNGQTPLHLASQKGCLKIVEMLLNDGADFTRKDETEETAFLQAAETGRDDIIKDMLIRNEKVINDEDEYSNTALHKAAENGHLTVVRTLVEWGAVREARNNRSWTPLDIAASEGHAAIVLFLLNEDVSPNPQDKNKLTPLHLAAKYGHAEAVQCLIAGGADVGAVTVNGHNALDLAIASGHRNVVVTILRSKFWHIALANETCKEMGKTRITPLRKLFKKMPDVTPLVLTQCMVDGYDVEGGDYVEFNYDFIDDTYTDYADLRNDPTVPELKDKALPLSTQTMYSADKNWIKENHPLSRLATGDMMEYEDLIGHPLVLALIRHKWMSIRVFYFLFLSFYISYVALITAYMIDARAPYIDVNLTMCRSTNFDYQTEFQVGVMYVIWVMSAIGIVIELVQAIAQGLLYLEFTNLLDWYTYVSSSIVVAEIGNNCGLKLDWQWQMGSFTVLFSWLGMLLFLRRLPGLGIYVVMIVEILKTFLKFFFVFFLFVVAFAMSYHILLQNQAPFSTPFYAISKTWVMMLGEMDYGDIFHTDQDQTPYQEATFAMFWLFLALMAIILMNLLTGLAVDDVNLLQKKAKIVKLKLQIELALDIELAMPEIWRRSTKSTIRRQRIYRRQDSNMVSRMMENVQIAIEGPLLSRTAVIEAVNNLSELNDGESPEVQRLESRLNHHISASKEDIKSVHQKLDQIEQLLRLQGMSRGFGGGGMLFGDEDFSTRGGSRSRTPRPMSAIQGTETPRGATGRRGLKKKAATVISGMSFRKRKTDGDETSKGDDAKEKKQPEVTVTSEGLRIPPVRSRRRQQDEKILIESADDDETNA